MSEIPEFIIYSERFRDILPPASHVVQLATGFGFTEGPAWVAEGNYLLFSDIPRNEIRRWSPRDGLSTWRSPSNHANGNTLDREGRLITCEHGTRRVTRTEADGQVAVLAERYCGKRLNSPNDAVVKSDGSIWFTDPPYGIPAEKIEQPHNYVFRLDPGADEPVPVADDFSMPNGLCFSPDESFIYIADSSDRHHVRVFKVGADNTLSDGEVFAVIEPGVPDGMRADAGGRLYTTAADGVHVYSPDGTCLGKILVPEVTANCTFSMKDGRTLFMTATTSLYAVDLNATGAR